jgi:hypothetical protein
MSTAHSSLDCIARLEIAGNYAAAMKAFCAARLMSRLAMCLICVRFSVILICGAAFWRVVAAPGSHCLGVRLCRARDLAADCLTEEFLKTVGAVAEGSALFSARHEAQSADRSVERIHLCVPSAHDERDIPYIAFSARKIKLKRQKTT